MAARGLLGDRTARTPSRHPARRKRCRRCLGRGSDSAASQLIGFLVAMFVFVAAIVALFAFYPSGAEEEELAKSGLNVQTATAMHLIVTGTGTTKTGQSGWYLDPDNLTQFGLLVEGRSSVLDGRKASAMSKGSLAEDSTNGYLDYPEAKRSMGLVDEDFHLRSYPIFDTLDSNNFRPLADISVLYVGDFSRDGGGGVGFSTVCVGVDGGSYVSIECTITNTGTQASVFQVTFDTPLEEGSIVDVQNTYRLAAAETDIVSTRLYKTTGWTWASETQRAVNITVTDTVGTLATTAVPIASDMGDNAIPGNTIAGLVVDTGKSYYRNATQSDDTVRLAYSALNGTGAIINNQGVDIYAYNSTGSEVAHFSETVRRTGQNRVDWDTPDSREDRYNLTISAGGVSNNEEVEVTDQTVGPFQTGTEEVRFSETAASVYERTIMTELVGTFKNHSFREDGDLFPDIKEIMNNDLANNLSRYDVLVVGSNVDQNAMTSDAAKGTVRDWVLSGGTLVVLGSNAQAVQWLQPLFHTSIETASGGIGVPDPTHPILHVPEELNFLSYVDNSTAWKIKSSDQFTHIVARGQVVAGSDTFDSLTISKPGSFGNGSIILTSWRPAHITDPQDREEARKLLYNFLAQAYGAGGSVFIDYGPAIPSDATVSASTRLMTITPVRLPRTLVEVRLVLYMFTLGK